MTFYTTFSSLATQGADKQEKVEELRSMKSGRAEMQEKLEELKSRKKVGHGRAYVYIYKDSDRSLIFTALQGQLCQ